MYIILLLYFLFHCIIFVSSISISYHQTQSQGLLHERSSYQLGMGNSASTQSDNIFSYYGNFVYSYIDHLQVEPDQGHSIWLRGDILFEPAGDGHLKYTKKRFFKYSGAHFWSSQFSFYKSYWNFYVRKLWIFKIKFWVLSIRAFQKSINKWVH